MLITYTDITDSDAMKRLRLGAAIGLINLSNVLYKKEDFYRVNKN